MKKPSYEIKSVLVSLLIGLSTTGLMACSDDKDGGDKTKMFSLSSAIGVQESLSALGCHDFRDRLFDSLQTEIRRAEKIPNLADLHSDLTLKLGQNFETRISEDSRRDLISEISDLYTLLLVEVPLKLQIKNLGELRRALGALQVGDRSSAEALELQNKISEKFQKISDRAGQSRLSCSMRGPKAETAFQMSALQNAAVTAQIPLPVLGLRKAFATAYQSCDSLKLNPMTRRSPDTEGIEDAGPYPGSSTGRYYKITDPVALAKTHYYVKDFRQGPGCVDVKKSTMIYDFGGKPYTTAAADSSLNYWKTSSGGSKGLGIDCSGYVFTSHAAAGLRLVAGRKMKAVEVEYYPAAMYVNPSGNGLNCLNKVSMGKSGSLQAGDVIASKYHVAMIERVGADPLAIKKYDDCNQITYRDFDFVIAQSSPDHGEIGINKYDAVEYLAPLLKFIFRSGLETYARQACEAYHRGQNVSAGTSSFGVSRHKMTADCLQAEIKLESQSCIESCRELLE